MVESAKKDTLRIYRDFSPSKRKMGIDLERSRENLYRDRLKLPLQIFDGARILEFGPGSGETSIYYGLWGAQMTLVEINPQSCDLLHDRFAEYEVTSRLDDVIQADFEDFHPNPSYDINSCECFSKGFGGNASQYYIGYKQAPHSQ
jgi:cyclopropane fatty-acyl-phospholipid synthase-like methyltransferase